MKEATRIRETRPCEVCAKPFRDSHKNQTTCSLRCAGLRRAIPRTGPEPEPIDGACRVPLGHAEFAIVDAADFERVSAAGLWTLRKEKREVYRNIDGRVVSLPHFVLGVGSDTLIDHRDGDRLNNRRANLRVATNAENLRNTAKRFARGSASSRFKGVHWAKGNQKWCAMIKQAGKARYLGLFGREEDAARAYDAAAREAFGEFACVNFPVGNERGAVDLTDPAFLAKVRSPARPDPTITHCPIGHALGDQLLFCRTCHRDRERERRRKVAQERARHRLEIKAERPGRFTEPGSPVQSWQNVEVERLFSVV